MFYVIATPIGNLEDITLRALRVLREVDFVLCEDTRRTAKLLQHYKIKTSTFSYHAHSKQRCIKKILDLLEKGKDLALVCDSGTPGISDPGVKLVSRLVGTAKRADTQVRPYEITCVPGPSALTAAASISSLSTNHFLFLGFLPRKKGRKKLLKSLGEEKRTIIFYESPHRIKKTLKEFREFLGEIKIEVFRELTKKFETVYRGSTSEVLAKLPEKVKGEIVVIVSPSRGVIYHAP